MNWVKYTLPPNINRGLSQGRRGLRSRQKGAEVKAEGGWGQGKGNLPETNSSSLKNGAIKRQSGFLLGTITILECDGTHTPFGGLPQKYVENKLYRISLKWRKMFIFRLKIPPKLPIKKLVLAHFGFWIFYQNCLQLVRGFHHGEKIHPPPFQLLLVVVKDVRLPSHVAMNTRPPRSGCTGWGRIRSSDCWWQPEIWDQLTSWGKGSWHPIIYDGFGKHPNGGWLWDFWLPSTVCRVEWLQSTHGLGPGGLG